MKLVRRTSLLALMGLCLLPAVHAASSDTIHSGDLLIANHQVIGNGEGIVKIDPVTSAQTVIAKGGMFGEPNDVVLGPFGKLYVADASAATFAGAVLSVGPGKKVAIVSSGGLLGNASGIAVEANGQLLVAHLAPSIVRVDPTTGAQSVAAMLPGSVQKVTVESTGQILVPILDSPPRILRIDPVSGSQSVISAGGLITAPTDIGIASNGDLIVLNTSAEPGLVIRVDPVSGAQSVISSGGLLITATGLAVAANDDIFVVDQMLHETPDGRVIRIDPVTGAQSIFSEGGKLLDPLDISIVP